MRTSLWACFSGRFFVGEEDVIRFALTNGRGGERNAGADQPMSVDTVRPSSISDSFANHTCPFS